MSCFAASPSFSLPVILVHVHLGFICPNISFFRTVQALMRSSESGLLVVKWNQRFTPCCFHSQRRLLILDLDDDTPTPSKALKTRLNVVKLFFFAMEIILSSCTFVVFCGFSDPLGVAELAIASLLFIADLLILPLLQCLLSDLIGPHFHWHLFEPYI